MSNRVITVTSGLFADAADMSASSPNNRVLTVTCRAFAGYRLPTISPTTTAQIPSSTRALWVVVALVSFGVSAAALAVGVWRRPGTESDHLDASRRRSEGAPHA